MLSEYMVWISGDCGFDVSLGVPVRVICMSSRSKWCQKTSPCPIKRRTKAAEVLTPVQGCWVADGVLGQTDRAQPFSVRLENTVFGIVPVDGYRIPSRSVITS